MRLLGVTLAKSCIDNQYPILENIEHHAGLCDEIYVGVPRKQTDATTKEIQKLRKRLKSTSIHIVKIPWNDGSPVAWSHAGQYKEVLAATMAAAKAKDDDWWVKMDADEFLHEDDFQEVRTLCRTANALHEADPAASYSTLRLGLVHFTGSLRTHQGWHPACDNGVMKIYRHGSSHVVGDGANFTPAGWSRVMDCKHIYVYHTGYCQDEERLRKRFAEHAVNIRDVVPGAKVQPFDMGQYKLAMFPQERLPKILFDNRDKFDYWPELTRDYDISDGPVPYFR